MDRPLRLISANPVDALARTVEALLVVAAQPLSTEELAEATADDAERVRLALQLLSERYTEGRSGIVLERVAGGWAFRAAREAAQACARLFERPVQRGLSPAALETLAIVASSACSGSSRCPSSRASTISEPTSSSFASGSSRSPSSAAPETARCRCRHARLFSLGSIAGKAGGVGDPVTRACD
jgi:hypothetical protein